VERDYYKILGVDRDADEKQIKKAYRTIIRYCHPDSPDCRMTKDELLGVQEAYETLANPEKRARYDRANNGPPTRRAGAGRAGTGSRGTDPRGSVFEDDVVSDLFSFFRDPFSDSAFLRRDGRSPIPERGLEIALSRAEALRGGLFEIAIPGPGGIPAGTIVVRIAAGVRSGTEAVVDLSETLGVRQRIHIAIVVEDDDR
jgi:curved DNA-binding protein